MVNKAVAGKATHVAYRHQQSRDPVVRSPQKPRCWPPAELCLWQVSRHRCCRCRRPRQYLLVGWGLTWGTRWMAVSGFWRLSANQTNIITGLEIRIGYIFLVFELFGDWRLCAEKTYIYNGFRFHPFSEQPLSTWAASQLPVIFLIKSFNGCRTSLISWAVITDIHTD